MRIARLPLALAVLVLLLALGRAAPAAAQAVVCEVLRADPIAGTFDHFCQAPIFCAPGDDVCDSSGYVDPVCGTSAPGIPAVCRPRCGTVVGCTADDNCRWLGGEVGDCRRVGDATAGFAVCAFPTVGLTYCGAAGASLDDPTFARCHTRPDGSTTANYMEGNCDGDGCPNAGDTLPCVNDRAPCFDFDPGVVCSVALPDAGVPDGGNVIDAGVVVIDASVRLDAGPTEPEDAGTTEPFDANELGPVSFGGGGGCRCVVGTGVRAPSATLAVLALGIALVGRARGRSKHVR